VIVCDTGPLLAAANEDDSEHTACLATLDHGRFRQIAPNHCVALELVPGEHELARHRR